MSKFPELVRAALDAGKTGEDALQAMFDAGEEIVLKDDTLSEVGACAVALLLTPGAKEELSVVRPTPSCVPPAPHCLFPKLFDNLTNSNSACLLAPCVSPPRRPAWATAPPSPRTASRAVCSRTACLAPLTTWRRERSLWTRCSATA